MAIVPVPYLSPQGPGGRMDWELRSLTARHVSPLNGVATTLERPGAHWAANLAFQNLATARRARLQRFLASCRGHANRFYMPTFGWTLRGSFPATELIANNTFASGVGTWAGGSDITRSVVDGVLRGVLLEGGQTSTARLYPDTNLTTVTQYAPHALRALASLGRPGYGPAVTLRVTDSSGGGTTYASTTGTLPSLITLAHTPFATSLSPQLLPTSTTMAGAEVFLHWMSLARCMLVDNGPNMLLQSDEFDTSWAATRTSVDDQSAGTTDPLATSTADSIIEDATASNTHYVGQTVTLPSSSALDYSFGVALKAGTRTWAQLSLAGSTTGFAQHYFDLGNGVLGSGTSDGTGWTNVRAFMQSLGNGWYYCGIVARNSGGNSTTSVRVGLATGNGGGSYSGDGTSNIYAWRATLAQSSVPTRLVQTTTPATTGTSQTGGALYLRGLPASTNGLLLPGDPAEIIIGTTSQLARTVAPLNSDAAGLGYWQFEPPLRVSPSDGAAVIVCNPLCKMMLDSNTVGWTDRAGGFSDLEFSAVEDTYPS